MEETKPKPKYSKLEKGYIGILAGAASDISKFDFTPWGFDCFHIESKEFSEFIKTHSKPEQFDHNWEMAFGGAKSTDIIDQEFAYPEYLYSLFPLDLSNPPSRQGLIDVLNAIRVILPSSICLKDIFGIQIFDDSVIYLYGHEKRGFNEIWYKTREEGLLRYSEDQLDDINKFLSIYFDRVPKLKYVQNVIKYYSSSFDQYDNEMQFVSLSISLETVVHSKEQLTYRFRRNLAALCGKDLGKSRKIQKDARALYNFRSKVVHSSISKDDLMNLSQFADYSMFLASRMIIEMILHNFPTIGELSQKLSEVAIGNRTVISNDYQPFDLNIESLDRNLMA